MEAKERKKAKLKDVLNGLKADQERVIEALERVRGEQSKFKSSLEEKTTKTIASRQAVEKLRPYAEQSPQALEASLQELSTSLNNDRALIEALDRRSRALQSSCDAFSTVKADVRTCTSLLNELRRDVSAEEQTAAAAAKGRDVFHERSNNVRDVERQEKMLQKQLENVQRRTDKLRKNAEERREGESKKMEEMKKINEHIRRERGEKGREMERRRVRIEQTEKKVRTYRLNILVTCLYLMVLSQMADFKENIDNEVHSAHDEYVKMDSHIRLYIKEMEQSIA